ncbi:permease prefix domain 1-containing protein [Herbidospora solisilvae]|uniref:permease prefix domain 1-containing protein n=1 Tax=Herbidospora solisilvae TaxID=2696284 RepID=UPI001929B3D3|nr:permease prefix domain 1-containing protein [Herbidospora solisilvae]
MDTAFETATVDDYVAALAKTLRGPRRARRDLLAEARDGLCDAAEAYAEEGLSPEEAQARAVADFGPVAEVAPGFQEELTAVQVRHTALLLFLGTPVLALMWTFLWQIFPAGPGYASRPDWFDVVAKTVDVMQLLTGLAGGVALWRVRRTRRSRRVAKVLGLLVWCQLPLMAVLSSALTETANVLTAFEDYVPGMVATWLSLSFWSWKLWSAAHCLRTAVTVPKGR